MKHLFLFFLAAACTIAAIAQKSHLDTNVIGYDKWPRIIGLPAISNDGRYTLYTINNRPARSSTLVIQSTNGQWKMAIPGASSGVITPNSSMAVFIKPKDSLCILTLGSHIKYIPNVSSFRLTSKEQNQWLVYLLNTPEKKLVVNNLLTGKEQTFTGVKDYQLSEDGKVLLLQTESHSDTGMVQSLLWITPGQNNTTTLWTTANGEKASNMVVDKNYSQLAFTVEKQINNEPVSTFWYYKVGTAKAMLLADNASKGIDSRLYLDMILFFSRDGNKLFFTLKEPDLPKPNAGMVKVDIWNYKDTKLQSQQLKELYPKNYAALIHIRDHRIIRLQQNNELALIQPNDTGDFIIIDHMAGNADYTESNWNPALAKTVYILGTNNESRKQVKEVKSEFSYCRLSPDEKFLLYYAPEQKNYFSYELASGITRNITKNIPTVWTLYNNDEPVNANGTYPVEGWLKSGTAVFLRDQHDIWLTDMAGNNAPVNITNGYGRRHNIEFHLPNPNHTSNTHFAINEPLILHAFNRNTKESGFFTKQANKPGDPELLTMGPNVYDDMAGYYFIKALNANVYLVRRESASQSPNYFSTKDFKSFIPLTDIYPEKNYNWLTAELISWKMFDGRMGQGVLYKPENFDEKRKYPIIFHYYEKKSDHLYTYQTPVPISDELNIPWFVNRGYLVFTPDIYYTLGDPGQSVYNSVVSAARYLSKFSWVDSTRMGIQGHSFGGYETNYLVTHTNIFAAAMSSSGFSNLISWYGSVAPGQGFSLQHFGEVGQTRIGYTLWQNPDLYIKNSPIFHADKVTTPLLMMNNREDGIVPFAQGVEFFTALRRLGKKVWMLQYDGGAHSVYNKEAVDYTTRMTQFFDHYLKGAPAPKWLTEGIPARLKGIANGLEFDTSIDKP